MERDTVLLSLEEYNDLRDFKKQIKSGKSCTIIRHNYYTHGVDYVKYYTDSEAIEEITSINKKLGEQINLLIEEVESLKKERESLKKSKNKKRRYSANLFKAYKAKFDSGN